MQPLVSHTLAAFRRPPSGDPPSGSVGYGEARGCLGRDADNRPRYTALLLLVILVTWPGMVFAQQAVQQVRQHRYTDAIETLAESPDADASILGVAHLRRAYFLRDLAELHVYVGQHYYQERLTSEEAESSWTTYFLGRHLFAQGQTRQALKHFEAAMETPQLPASYRQRARLWAAACYARLGDQKRADALWQAEALRGDLQGERAYAQWQTGVPFTSACSTGPASSAAALRCRLWETLRMPDAAARSPLHHRLLNEFPSDQETEIDDDFVLRFYDPATLNILAQADFVAAMEAFERYKGSEDRRSVLLYAGISAYEAGYPDKARTFLQQTDHALRTVYLGALDYEAGDTKNAEQHWAQARAAAPAIALEWASVAADYDHEHEHIEAVAATHSAFAATNQQAGRLLGRVFLKLDQPAEALHVLLASYPALYNNELDRIEPGYLITLSRAKFASGRGYYPAVRSHLASLINAYPIVESVLYLVQAYTAPERTMGKKRTG